MEGINKEEIKTLVENEKLLELVTKYQKNRDLLLGQIVDLEKEIDN